MAIELTDKVCLITGADEGVGRGLVRGFVKRGARVAAGLLHYEQHVHDTQPAYPVQMDVTNTEQVTRAVAQVIEHFGRLDVLVNNAGIYPRCAAEAMTFSEWRRILDLNLDGAWRCCEAVLPQMKNQASGVIINVGSITLRRGGEHMVHYLASKGGIVGLTRGLARDLGRCNVRVNCVHLGAVRTEGELRLFPNQGELLKVMEERQALRGRMTPDTVEPVFAFLASDDSGDVTGQCVTVDRGWTHD